MSHQYKAVAAILKNTISSINEILKDPNDEMHRIRITGVLQQQHDQLLLLTGSGDLETGKGAVLGPAKTIGGKPIPKLRKFTADDMIPADDKVNNLRKQVDAAIDYFGAESNAEGILANIPELIIRGVAKKAGLPYKKDEVETITVKFIEQVKAAVAVMKGANPEETKGRLSIETLSNIANALNGNNKGAEDLEADDDEVEAAIGNLAETVNETPAEVITVGDPKPSDSEAKETFEGLIANLKDRPAEAPKEQPKAEEPKQETKPEPKKKTGK